MNIALQRRLDRIIGSPLCRLLSLLPRGSGKAPPSAPRAILIIILSEMGSLVLAKPMFDFLRKTYPGAALYVLVFAQNREVLEILNVVPSGNILTVSNRSLISLLRDSLRVLYRLRRLGIDAALDCELFARISSIYAFLSGADIIAGFHPHTQEGLYRGDFIHRPVPYNPYHHISEQFLTLAAALQSGEMPAVKRAVPRGLPKLEPLPLDRDKIEALRGRLLRDFPSIGGRRLILIYPGGGLLPIRAWPLGSFCRLAGDLVGKGYAVGIIGMEEDRSLAGAILAYCGNEHCLDLTGYTKTIRDLLMLFHVSALLITNDGGPGHFAALTPLPAIVFYGPETPVLYGTLGREAVFFYRSLSCSPCLTAYNHRNSPCNGNNRCLKGIPPEAVLAKAYDLLEGKGTGA